MSRPPRLARLTRGGTDRGSGGVSYLLLLGAVALFVVFGLVVDGGAKARAIDRASQIAYEAARAGLSGITPGQDIDVNAVDQAVEVYLDAQGATGYATVHGNTVDVEATISQRTTVLRMIGKTQWTITGHGSATLVYR